MSEPNRDLHDPVDALLNEQSLCWRKGERMLAEQYLQREAWLREDEDALLTLLYQEVLLRKRLGETPALEEYLARFPQFAHELRRLFDVQRVLDLEGSRETRVSDGKQQGGNAAPGILPAIPGYELLDELGRGGMGVVYRARQLLLGRVVALKMILAGGHADEEERVRFLGEAEAVARLRHPNIVQLYEAGRHESLPYFTLEYISGGSLADRLREGPLPPAEAARLAEGIARGVQHAHEQGIIHRDLKPANVLLAEGGTPKVTDFGLAKRIELGQGLTVTGHVVGTPQYMAPEQASGEGKRVGPAADIYAVGAILYECLTGRPPFRAATPMDTLWQVCHEEPVSVRHLQPKTPLDLETICLKCLEKEPQRRYRTVKELAEDLGRFLAGHPVTARPVGVLGRAVKWAKRRPAVAVLTAAVALTAALGAGLVTWKWRDAVYHQKQAEEAAQQAMAAGEAERLAREEVTRAVDAERQAKEDTARKANAEAAARAKADAELERAEQNLYLDRIALAQREWENAHVREAFDLLDACPADRRGWEWHYLRRLCHGSKLTLRGHSSRVNAVAFSPDGARLASGGDDATVNLWDLRTGQNPLTLRGHQWVVTAVSFDPSGTRVASTSWDQTVKVWDTRTGQMLLSLHGHANKVRCVAFSPDGRWLASGSDDRTVKVWDARTGKEIVTLKGHPYPVTTVSFIQAGTRVASAGGSAIRIWDWQTPNKEQVATLTGGGSGWPDSLSFSPDGTRIASADTGGAVQIWNVQTGLQEDVFIKGHYKPNTVIAIGNLATVAFSPDGTRLASGSQDQTVKVWDARMGTEIITLRGHTDDVRALAFSPDGTCVASVSEDKTVKVWDLRTGQHARPIKGNPKAVHSLAFNPDGTHLASAGADDVLKVWDTRTWQAILSFKGYAGGYSTVSFNPDGTRLAGAGKDKRVKVWDAQPGQEILTLTGHTDGIHTVAFSPDGTHIGSASSDKTVKVWNLRTGQATISLSGGTSDSNSIAFSPDGKRLAIACTDKTVKVWDTHTGQELVAFNKHMFPVRLVAFSPDGKRIASAGGYYNRPGEVKIWDSQSGQELLNLKGHTRYVTAIAFSPDGTRVVSGAADRTMKVWDARTGAETLSLNSWDTPLTGYNFQKGLRTTFFLPESDDFVFAVAFRPDSKQIASASGSFVKVWDGRPAHEALSLKGHTGEVTCVSFSPDSKYLASGSLDMTVKLWDVQKGQEERSFQGHTRKIQAVVFSPTGSHLNAVDEKRVWKTWEISSGREVTTPPLQVLYGQYSAWSPDRRFFALLEWDKIRLVDMRVSDDERADLRQLVALDPTWHEEQAQQAEYNHDWFAAAFHLQRLLRLRPADPGLYQRRARVHAERGEWVQAVADFTHASKLSPYHADFASLARAQLAAGDTTTFQQTWQRLHQQHGVRQSTALTGLIWGRSHFDPFSAALVARQIARPLPQTMSEIDLVARLAVVVPDLARSEEDLLAKLERASPLFRGPALCRAGKCDAAAAVFAGLEKLPPDSIRTYLLLFKALAEHGRGNPTAGRQALSQATAWLDAPSTRYPQQTNFAALDWGLRVELEVLRRECEQKLGVSRAPGKMERIEGTPSG